MDGSALHLRELFIQLAKISLLSAAGANIAHRFQPFLDAVADSALAQNILRAKFVLNLFRSCCQKHRYWYNPEHRQCHSPVKAEHTNTDHRR